MDVNIHSTTGTDTTTDITSDISGENSKIGTKDLCQLIAEVVESEPEESKKLRKGLRANIPEDPTQQTVNSVLKSSNSSSLTKDARCELAVMVVKRAFSQCPNLTLLVSNSVKSLDQGSRGQC